MSYSSDDLQHMQENIEKWYEHKDKLIDELFGHKYQSSGARTMAMHGVLRRLHTLCHCMDRTFEFLNPDEQEPSKAALLDATVFVQTFVLNTYGALDNVARIWVMESELQPKGKPIPRQHIGLGPKFKSVRESLSKETQKYLEESDNWFNYIENYRHALAHRIPLYIIPRQLDEEANAQYQLLEVKKAIASKERKYSLWDELRERQEKLGIFSPLMMHSYGDDQDDGTPVRFHGQMICDLATVIEITQLILKELKALPKK